MSGIVGKNLGRGSGVVTATPVGADAVSGSNLADDACDSEHYTDASIDEAHISDNAITLAKMASGTDGQIITYDASGNPSAVGPGTDGQVLTSTGAGSPPAFEAAGGITCKNVFSTFDLSTGDATVNYTGAGFQPSAAICFYNVPSDIVGGWSVTDYTTSGDTGTVKGFYGPFPGKVSDTTAPFVRIDIGAHSSTGNPTVRVYGTWSSHADGITITYDSTLATPSSASILYLRFLFIK
jgi:hypothetical protein